MVRRKLEPQKIRPGTELPRRVPIPARQFAYWPVEIVGAHQELVRTILSDRACVLQTHYFHTSKKRRLCTLPLWGTCEFHEQSSVDTYAYVVVWSPVSQSNAIIGIPRTATLKCSVLANDEPTFGRELRLKRKGMSKFGPLTAYIPSYVTNEVSEERLVPWQTLQRHLLHLWRIELVEDRFAGMTEEEAAELLKQEFWAKLKEKRKAK